MDDSTTTTRMVIDTVNLDDPYSVAQWTEIWDVSPAELIEAVRICGPIAADLKRYFRLRRL